MLDNYKTYRNEKNRQDRLDAQRRYYYKNRERILAKRRAKREGRKEVEEPPVSEKVKPSTLVDLYHNLKNYLESEKLI